MIASGRQILGNLADVEPENFRDNVFINRSGAIQYLLKPLTTPAEEVESFAGYISSLEENYVDNDIYTENRINNFKDEVKDELFVFTYRENDESEYQKILKAYLVPKPQIFDNEAKFIQIPVFASKNDELVSEWAEAKSWKLYREYNNINEFLIYVLENRPLGSIYGFDAEYHMPEFILWKDADSHIYALGQIDNMEYDEVGSLVINSSNLSKEDINEFLKYMIYDIYSNPTVAYIPEKIYKIVLDKLKTKKREVITQENSENNFYTLADAIYEMGEVVKDSAIEISLEHKNDEMIISFMDYYSRESNLYYDIKDFVNFHTAMKCSNLVILSGLSGTGKSQLVEIYAKALGIDNDDLENEQLLFVPVRPSWNDDSDLLGYVDLIQMTYRPSDTGFIDLLINAQKEENKDKMYIVCFDEMNLARVEHYFSQFLSILERPTGKRELRLYDNQYTDKLKNSDKYPSRIQIGDNIRFVGTVNIDETTYHFSDKVLDRANVIQLNVVDYSKEWYEKNYVPVPKIKWTSEKYNKLVLNDLSENEYMVTCLLWDMHSMLQKANPKLGIGPRIVEAIETFIANIPLSNIGGFDERNAIDCQILQRVMPKIRGSENQLGDILKKESEQNFYKIFDKYSDISDFNRCKDIVLQKQKELYTYGYCI